MAAETQPAATHSRHCHQALPEFCHLAEHYFRKFQIALAKVTFLPNLELAEKMLNGNLGTTTCRRLATFASACGSESEFKLDHYSAKASGLIKGETFAS
jgi:hypothetical protein